MKMVTVGHKFRLSLVLILLLFISISMIGFNKSNGLLSLSQDPEKVIVWAYPNPFGTENSPTDVSSSYGRDYMASIYNSLMRRTTASNREFVSDLAVSMPVVSSDYRNWTFTLKPGLKFSDGSDLNASSVVFSYKVHLNPDIEGAASKLAVYMTSASIYEIDYLTVQFNLTQTFTFAPSLFSQWIYSENHFGPQYDACLADITLAACNWNTDLTGGNLQGGSGPFMVDTYDTTNNFIEMIPNPFYHMANQIKIDRIVIKTISDVTAAKVAFTSGETDIFDSRYRVKNPEFANLTGITDIFVGALGIQEMVPNHNNQYYGLGEYTTTGANAKTSMVDPLENARAARNIRKAMSHIIDRVFIADEITGGLSTPAATIMPTISIGWDATLLPRVYSQEIAKGYMEAAGFDYTGKTFDPSTGAMNAPFFSITVLSPTGYADREQWAAIMVQELPKIGIGVDHHETGGFSTVIYPRTFTHPSPPPSYAEGGYDIFFVGWSFGIDFDPVGLYELEFQNPDCCNVYNYNNITTETAIADYVGELDAAARLPLVKRVQELLYDDQPSLPIVHTAEHWAWASNILGLDGLSMSQKIIEWELVEIVAITETSSITTIVQSSETSSITTIVQSTETSSFTTTDQSTETSSITTTDQPTETSSISTTDQTSETSSTTTIFETTTKISSSITTDSQTTTNSQPTTKSQTDSVSLPISLTGLFIGLFVTLTITLSNSHRTKKFE